MAYVAAANDTLNPGARHWPHFHELGHNHAAAAWTWGCTAEVTCNFFAAWAQYTVGVGAVLGVGGPWQGEESRSGLLGACTAPSSSSRECATAAS